jgi:NADPH-dependent curcumin reductase CurA
MQHKGGITAGKTVLVTAAAGGTGHFAVQIAKLKGCQIIATCGSAEKVERLLAVGADRVINYKEEVAALLH